MRTNTGEKEDAIRWAFELGIILKGINGTLEISLGLLLLLSNLVNEIILALAQSELIENSNDFFASHLYALANPSHHTQVFSGLYLITHGTVKVLLVFGLWRDKLWAYPAAITFISLFISYQTIRILQSHSILLTIFTLLDCTMVWLIYHEYQRKLRKIASGKELVRK